MSVSCAEFTKEDDKILLADSRMRYVWLVEAETLKSLEVLSGNKSPCYSLNISKDGKLAAAALCDKNSIKIWDLVTPKLIISFDRHEDKVLCVNFNSTGEKIVSVSMDNDIKIWNPRTGKVIIGLNEYKLQKLPKYTVHHAVFSPDDDYIVLTNHNKVEFIHSDSLLYEPDWLSSEPIHTAAISYMSFSPDGTGLVTSSFDQTAIIWRVKHAKAAAVLEGHQSPLACCAWSPDGLRIVTGDCNGEVKVWCAITGELITTIKVSDQTIYFCSWAHNSDKFLVCSDKLYVYKS